TVSSASLRAQAKQSISPQKQAWIASSQALLAMTGQRVGWVEPTGRANARPMINSAIPIVFRNDGDGFREGLNPYAFCGVRLSPRHCERKRSNPSLRKNKHGLLRRKRSSQ